MDYVVYVTMFRVEAYYVFIVVLEMARGQQKLQSQAKAAEKTNKLKKQQGHSAQDQKKAAQKALVHLCFICKVCHLTQNI